LRLYQLLLPFIEFTDFYHFFVQTFTEFTAINSNFFDIYGTQKKSAGLRP